jgi:hypothetical protein
MEEKTNAEMQVLALLAEEHYAHARDHEHLRAEVTTILVAAAFVLIGLAVDKSACGARLYYVALLSVLIGVLNLCVAAVHESRFKRHVKAAREARSQIAIVDIRLEEDKFLDLGIAWLFVAALPIFAGPGLVLVAYLDGSMVCKPLF